MAELLASSRARLLELEEKIPWSAVKKKWTPKRQSWLNSVQHASNLTALIKRLCMLEAALKQESLEPSWPARRDEWRAELTEAASGEAILVAVASLEGAIAWDRVRDDVLALERRRELERAAMLPADGGGVAHLAGAAAADGGAADGYGAEPAGARARAQPRAGAGLGKRPRATLSAGSAGQRCGLGTAGTAGAASASAVGCTEQQLDMLRARAQLVELCARGEAEWEQVLTEASVPTREQLLCAPLAERVPAAALRMLALLEATGVGGRHEGAVVIQLLELVHRHAASLLADAVDCCAHRAGARARADADADARLHARDVRMAAEMELVVLAQAGPPPREVLAHSGCCAINALPLPLLPDCGLGVVLPGRAECLASLRI
ncbi:hypothetical protein KFE25_005913 [Diacronema lutheri]|uniref:Uncharacterized protein n=1 Tax=Diacronema lutheri TaxID=2081491 RepID=A0A8J5XK77_DIALT|nr:hypothetical protein KFE25_005913 [Diacronema lutheri]